MHDSPIPPPSPPARARRRLFGLTAPSVWVPLLVACAVAAVALFTALGGSLPGQQDAADSAALPTTAAPTTSAVSAPSTSAVATTSAVASPTTSVVPPPPPPPPPSTAAAAPPSPETTTPATTAPAAPKRAPAPAPAPDPEPAPAPAPAPAPVVAPAAPGPEGQVLALVNAERSTAGCAPVRADEGLAAVARAHSADMRDRDFFDHDNPDGLDPFDRAEAAGIGYARAENIAQGQRDAAEVMADWMDSPGHRANILDCDLGRLGVGVAQGSGGPWWTQLFGS